jgi:hypothetical protein
MMKSTKQPASPASAGAKPSKNHPDQATPEGTERWPKVCVEDGEWFQLPKVILKKFGKLGIEPQHLLLLLVLQTDRFRNRPHRYYWEELASLCGCTKNTVRRWGYELRKKGLLIITPVQKRLPGEERRVGYRNARSIFDLKPFEHRVEQLQLTWQRERASKAAAKDKSAAA